MTGFFNPERKARSEDLSGHGWGRRWRLRAQRLGAESVADVKCDYPDAVRETRRCRNGIEGPMRVRRRSRVRCPANQSLPINREHHRLPDEEGSRRLRGRPRRDGHRPNSRFGCRGGRHQG
jgi:hypothetical protein